jgi:hypothetical protein
MDSGVALNPITDWKKYEEGWIVSGTITKWFV